MDLFGLKFNLPQLFNQRKERIPFGRAYNVGGSFSLMGNDGKVWINKGYNSNLTVYSIINKILRAASKAEWTLEVQTSEGWEGLESHDVLDLLNNPNPVNGKSEFIESVLGYKLITGESMIFQNVAENGVNAGLPLELWVLAPMLADVKHDVFGVPEMYKVKLGGNWSKTYEAENVVWLKYFNPDPNDPRGMSPLTSARLALQTNNDTYEAALKLLQNGGAYGVMNTDEFTNGETMKEYKRFWDENYAGKSAYGEIAFLGQKFNWTQIGLNAVDLALLETQAVTARDLCNVYGVSSQLLNDPENKTFANMQEARKDMISNVVIPELDLMAHEIQRSIVSKYEERDNATYRLSFNKLVWEELREDENAKVTMLSTAWWLTPNQKLAMQGKPMSDNPLMDEVFIPGNLLPLGFGSDEEVKALLSEYQNKE